MGGGGGGVRNFTNVRGKKKRDKNVWFGYIKLDMNTKRLLLFSIYASWFLRICYPMQFLSQCLGMGGNLGIKTTIS
jgi:hypothetical protein